MPSYVMNGRSRLSLTYISLKRFREFKVCCKLFCLPVPITGYTYAAFTAGSSYSCAVSLPDVNCHGAPHLPIICSSLQ